MSARRAFGVALAALVVLLAGLASVVALINVRGESPVADAPAPGAAPAAQIERGRYLALAGNCAGCHTARGGADYAGGVGVETPFGTVFAGNLTPDDETGLGRWNADHFWRALHHGRSRDGRLLYPAFPYTSYTRVTREDADALFAWLRTLPAVRQPNRPHALRFPYGTQAALAVWRALYFRPGDYTPDARQSAAWNRGAYLVNGLGHCADCHGSRNALGATVRGQTFAGAVLPGAGWYAPALDSAAQAGVAQWPLADVVALLKTGVAPHATVSGPMADVVYRSTQYLSDADARAMATYLQALPQQAAPRATGKPARNAGGTLMGEELYTRHCADCHGEHGGGVGAFPALSGNRAVNLASPANLIQVVRHGGILPSTAGNPRPLGMPPFGQVLSDADIAAVLTYVRASWDNDAPAVTPFEVLGR